MRIGGSLLAIVAVTALGGAVWASSGDAEEARAALGRGSHYYAQGNVRAARVELMNAIKADPANLAARIAQAQVLLDLEDAVGAQAELDRATALGARPEAIAHLVAQARLLSGDPDGALAVLAAAIPDQAANAVRIRARAYQAKGDVNAAKAEFEGALQASAPSAVLWTDIGRFRLETGDLAGAFSAAAEAVRIAPRNVKALVLAGELDRRRYGLAAAMPWFRKALDVDANNIPALLQLAATSGDAGDNRTLLDLTRRVLSLDQGNARAWYLQAVMAARAGKFDLARALLERTSGRLENEPAVRLLQASIDLQANAPERAIGELRTLVAEQSANLAARRLLGLAFWRAGDADGVIAALSPIAARADADSYSLTILGRALEAKGDRSAAAEILDRAANPQVRIAQPLTLVAADPSVDPLDTRAAVPIMAAQMAAGQAGVALQRAMALRVRNPGAPAAHVIVGDIFAQVGNWRGAVEAYRVAANLDFSEGTALRLARALSVSGDAASAISVVGLYLAQNPQSVPMRLVRADMRMHAGQWNSAIADLEIVRDRIGNRDAALLNNLAWAYLQLGEKAKSLAFAQAAYALSPNNAAVTATLGWARHKSGNRKGAVAMLAKAHALAPADPAISRQLAQARL